MRALQCLSTAASSVGQSGLRLERPRQLLGRLVPTRSMLMRRNGGRRRQTVRRGKERRSDFQLA
jgi:hypothetical protein